MAGGNYGGSSTPTVPVGGNLITTAAYKDYKCTSAYATAASGSFTYDGVTINLPVVGDTIDLVMSPSGIGSTDAKVVFLCYSCASSNEIFSGGSDSNIYDIYNPGGQFSGITKMFRSTIIGGGGLNS